MVMQLRKMKTRTTWSNSLWEITLWHQTRTLKTHKITFKYLEWLPAVDQTTGRHTAASKSRKIDKYTCFKEKCKGITYFFIVFKWIGNVSCYKQIMVIICVCLTGSLEKISRASRFHVLCTSGAWCCGFLSGPSSRKDSAATRGHINSDQQQQNDFLSYSSLHAINQNHYWCQSGDCIKLTNSKIFISTTVVVFMTHLWRFLFI